ncbi:MAG: DUF120 domain-containing protein [Thermoproteota archaeon]|nr:DUF120 domain-containing protein [Thermoproteota archaeon]
METVTIKGTVISGEGAGTKFVKLPWVKKQFIQKLGFNPYPGTLNLRLPAETKVKDLMGEAKGVQIKPAEGFFRGKCFKALVMKRVKGVVVTPEVPGYPADLLEVLAPVNLRKVLQLKDGEKVQVTIYLQGLL